jgi:hypothetical protein
MLQRAKDRNGYMAGALLDRSVGFRIQQRLLLNVAFGEGEQCSLLAVARDLVVAEYLAIRANLQRGAKTSRN